MLEGRAKPLDVVPNDAFDVAVERLSRDIRRSRRKRAVRARTIDVSRIPKRELRAGALLYPVEDHNRPRTRGECDQVQRPCPYVSCRYHLFLEVSPSNGSIKLNFPDLEPEEMAESCALDVAEQGGARLEHVGEVINVTRERVRQIEQLAFARLVERAGEALREQANDYAEQEPHE